jgi:hypothetical protein
MGLPVLRSLGGVLIVIGALGLLDSFLRFAIHGSRRGWSPAARHAGTPKGG